MGLLVLAAGLSLPASAADPPGARSRRAIEADLKFGAEMARQGLWHEALFRWERVLKDTPDDARLLNNIAVAAESLGQFDRARAAYARAVELSRDKQIASNFELFKRAHKPPENPEPEEVPAEPAPSSTDPGTSP